ncbi:hypothetical protein ACFE04_012923 [Oxalis oulophora]
MNYLPEEVVEIILINLSVKSLIRCTCVCKLWHGLIRSKTFINKHYECDHNKDTLLLTYHSVSAYYSVSINCRQRNVIKKFKLLSNDLRTSIVDPDHFNFPDSFQTLFMVGPCNGIFCFHDRHKGRGLLWNPANRECRILPLFPRYGRYKRSHYGWPSLLIGLDRRTNDYKVVVFPARFDGNGGVFDEAVAIYSLNNDPWRRFEGIVPFYPRTYTPNQRYLDGLLYWFQTINQDYRILSFDVSNEVFEEVTRPDFLLHSTVQTLTEYNNGIAIICGQYSCVEHCYDMWALSDSRWNKILTIGPILRTDYPAPMGYWKYGTGRVLLKNFPPVSLGYSAHCLLSYDPQTKQLSEDGEFYQGLEIYPYKESLVSLKKN